MMSRCWFGFHKWKQSRPLQLIDGFPMSASHENPTRECTRCGKKESWLPGYGGSEWGCWCPVRSKEEPQ